MDLLTLLIIRHLLDRCRGTEQQIDDGQDALDGFWWVLLGCGILLVVPCLLLFVIGAVVWVMEAVAKLFGG